MRRTAIALAAWLLVSMTTPVRAQNDDADLRRKIEALQAGQERIQADLVEIKKLLQQRAAVPAPAAARAGVDVEGVVFDLGDNPVKGASTAKLTLVEFSDYQ